jgi:hypothetical protein
MAIVTRFILAPEPAMMPHLVPTLRIRVAAGPTAYLAGSISVIGHARVGLLVAEDPDDEHLRVLAMPKINCGPKQESLRFALEPIGNVCRIGWAGTSHYSADELLQSPHSEQQKELQDERATKVEQAKGILEWLLESSTTGSLVVTQAKAELAKAGLHGSTIGRALRQLNLQVQYSVNADGERTYVWSPKPP